ncbi:hypothetical protein QQ045_002250 [Rhodiola kirilowii]
MDLKSSHASPVLADPLPHGKSRLGIHSSLIPCSQPGTVYTSGMYVTIPKKKTGVLDDVLSNGWLDDMIASSPPRKKFIKDIHVEVSTNDSDNSHFLWMHKCPSALASFEQISNLAKNKKIVVFLDYDGTLSPIVNDPDKAYMSTDMRSAVEDVAKLFPTAIISGRNRDQVYNLVGLTELYYAGSHGMDIMSPVKKSITDCNKNSDEATNRQDKDINLFQPAKEFLPTINEVYKILVERTKNIVGAKVEDHKFCASVHYRNVDAKDWSAVAQCVHDILKNYPRLRLTHGRKVLEIRPVIDWDKGKAVQHLLESLEMNARDDVLPIYIGDDRTDEDAFKVLRETNQGFGILVSSVPKETQAYYSVRNPTEVMEFLRALVRWKTVNAGAP